jgi:hypothetical protein
VTDPGPQANTLEILARAGDESRGQLRLLRRSVSVDTLRDSFEEFMSKLQAIVQLDRAVESPFELDEIQFSAEITADGGFRLLGSGASVQATSSVSLTLRRREP